MSARRLFLLALASLLFAGLVHADDKKKKKKDKEKEVQESSIESTEARNILDARITKKIQEEAWQDAFAGARELLDKYPDALVLVDETLAPDEQDEGRKRLLGLHGTTGVVLRRKLAGLPKEGVDALKLAFGDDAAHKLGAGRSLGDVALLLDCANRYFPLDEAAEALLSAGDLQLERGCLVGTVQAWRDVLELHPNPLERQKAARRLVAVLPLVGDSATTLDVASMLRKEAALLKRGEGGFEGAEELEQTAREIAGEQIDQECDDVAVDPSGGLAPVYSAIVPGVVSRRIRLKSDEVKAIDWRTEETTTNQWGQGVPVMRRMLFGHYATDDFVLVHMGKAIFAYFAHDDESYEPPVKEGDENWVFGKPGWIPAYLRDLIQQASLPRFGIAVCGSTVYATLARPNREDDEAGGLPVGRLVAFDLETGRGHGKAKAIFDTSATEEPGRKKRKKKDANGDETKELKLSYIGTPVLGGDRLFCPACNAAEPNETWITALDPKDGTLLWKRVLATSSAFNAQTNPWEAAYPRPMPAPSIAIVKGALIVLSNNGCVAALDPVDGRVLWARTYERDEDQGGNRQPWRRDPNEIQAALNRGYNPPLPLGDMVLTMPADSKDMQLVRVTDGYLLTKPRSRKDYDYILGVSGGKIAVAGEKNVLFYSVKHEKKVSLDPGRSVTLGHEKVTGRGVVANGWIYVPTDKRIVGMRLDDGKRKNILDWAKVEAGDLAIGGGRFVSIGARNAHTYKKEED